MPRFSQGWPQTAKSSGQGLRPTPNLKRSPEIAATEQADLAASTGLRTASLATKVVSTSLSVTAAMCVAETKGSSIGCAMNSRLPLWYG